MSSPPIKTPEQLVDYTATLDCIHCGLCLETCPTYTLTGVETSSPRGRIHLMRGVAEEQIEGDADYRDEMEFCLVCRHCESVCPAGIRMGEMMSVTRDAMYRDSPRSRLERLARWFGFRVLLPNRTALRLASSMLRFGQRSGLLALFARLSPLGKVQLQALLSLPPVPSGNLRTLLPPVIAPQDEHGQFKSDVERVSMLEGCVMPELYSGVNHATVKVLTRMGVEVNSTRSTVCCGALHAHNGDLEGARELARKTIAAFEQVGPDTSASTDPIVVNSAGCGAHMKEYAQLFETEDPWHARAASLAERVVDFSEFVQPLLASARLKLNSKARGPVTWDNPCHLCHGQKIREEPLSILKGIDFVNGGVVELADAESCCGSAGIYSALRPADSAQILEPKLDALERSGAKLLVTSNPGCQMQWQSGIKHRKLDVEVVHLAEVLAAALFESGTDSDESGE